MKRILAILPFFFIVGCASIATGIDTARNVVATTVTTATEAGADMVGAVAKDVSGVVSTTADITTGVVDVIGEEVKDQAEELEVEKPDFPTGELKENG
tara:strand:- start:388 stop:681 length:294 start_codon:yes stop_codon:yes gene_type:complete